MAALVKGIEYVQKFGKALERQRQCESFDRRLNSKGFDVLFQLGEGGIWIGSRECPETRFEQWPTFELSGSFRIEFSHFLDQHRLYTLTHTVARRDVTFQHLIDLVCCEEFQQTRCARIHLDWVGILISDGIQPFPSDTGRFGKQVSRPSRIRRLCMFLHIVLAWLR